MKAPESIQTNKRYIAYVLFTIFTVITNWGKMEQETGILQLAIASFALIELIVGVARVKPTEVLKMILSNIQHLRLNNPDKPQSVLDMIQNGIMFLMDNWHDIHQSLAHPEEGEA